MARSTQHQWHLFVHRKLRQSGQQHLARRKPFQRRLRIEPLEDRRLLAVVTVDTLDDTVNLNDGVTSLREAIFATNTVPGADTIDFAAAFTSGGPATLVLTQGELAITDALAINGPGANLLTIDASGNDPTPDVNNGDGSRVFNIDDANPDTLVNVSISGLTLTGGDVSGDGGAILTRENLSVTSSTISGNSAISQAIFAGGGGIFSDGNVTVTSSTISGNLARRFGGGIYARGNVTVTSSTISGNSAGGIGGGVYSIGGDLTVTLSTISGNSAGASGGGIFSTYRTLTVTNSTISGNSATYGGGGIYARFLVNLLVTDSTISGNSGGGGGGGIIGNNLTVTGSTISGNSATGVFGDGGGILSNGGDLTVTDSTISGNSAESGGGGIWIWAYSGPVTITNSIVAGNWRTSGTDPPVADDLVGSSISTLGYSFVGAAASAINTIPGTINYFGVDPRLGPLADNGGPTMTHALLPGSPAIDAGDPSAVAGVGGVPLYDQRGTPLGRVANGRIDIGAFELQPIPPTYFGDYNQNGVVDAADYTVWRNRLGQSGLIPYSSADGDGDGQIDAGDYVVWKAHFGEIIGGDAGSNSAEAASLAAPVALDATTAMTNTLAPTVGKLIAEQPVSDVGNRRAASFVGSTVIDRIARADVSQGRSWAGGSPSWARRYDALAAWLTSRIEGKPRHEDVELAGLVDDLAADKQTESLIIAVDEVLEALSTMRADKSHQLVSA